MTVFDTQAIPIIVPLPTVTPDNSIADMTARTAGIIIGRAGGFAGTGTITSNLFIITGTITVIDAFGQITGVTTLNNLTNIYFDVWDGTISVPITKTTGATLSGAPVGSIIARTRDSTIAVTTIYADQGRVTEVETVKPHKPFMVTAKNGVTTYLRVTYTTTDNPVAAAAYFYMVYDARSTDGSVRLA